MASEGGKGSAVVDAVIDSLAFAKDGRYWSSRVDLADLPRLQDALARKSGFLDVALQGEYVAEQNGGDGQSSRSYLLLTVEGGLWLECQRCLEPVEVDIAISTRFLLVPSGQPWPDEELADDGFDAIAADRQMALLPLIEDELLLSLPIAPRHVVCEAPHGQSEVVPDLSVVNPFAALAKLKKN